MYMTAKPCLRTSLLCSVVAAGLLFSDPTLVLVKARLHSFSLPVHCYGLVLAFFSSQCSTFSIPTNGLQVLPDICQQSACQVRSQKSKADPGQLHRGLCAD